MTSILSIRGSSALAFFALLPGFMVCCRPASAQHPDVLPYISAGQLTTDGFDDGDNSITPNLRVFNFVFGESDPAQPYFTGDPGFRTEYGGFTPGKHLRFNFLSGAPFGLPATLTYWDGSGTPHFGLVPSSETLKLEGVASATAASGNAQVPGFTIGSFDSAGELHVHLSSFLQGSDGNSDPSDGNNPANGIYLVALGLTTDMPGIADANPMFIVYSSGATDTQLDSAVDYVQANLVPEPSSIVLVLIGGVGLALVVAKRRRGAAVARS